MKQPMILALIGIALIAFGLFWRTQEKIVNEPSLPLPSSSPVQQRNEIVDVRGVIKKSEIPQEIKKFEPQSKISTAEINSLENMVNILAESAKENKKLNDVVEELKSSGQKPFLTKDQNPYTGEMVIVRTRSPLPGTRYFHAQYFQREDGNHFMQHMSFEFRPGPEAMKEAVRFVQNNFGNQAKPGLSSENFREWHLPNGYTVWIKKMEPDDLDPNDPFNSYSPSDVGTVRVVVEENPHDH